MQKILTAAVALIAVGMLSRVAFPNQTGEILALNQGEHRVSLTRPIQYVLKVDHINGGASRLVMLMEKMPPNDRIPVHQHALDDEIVFVQQGTVAGYLNGRRAILKAGGILYAPHGSWLGLQNTGATDATVFYITDHPGLDDYLRHLSLPAGQPSSRHITLAQVYALAARYHIKYRPDIPIVK